MNERSNAGSWNALEDSPMISRAEPELIGQPIQATS
jgi:hypothetical protein